MKKKKKQKKKALSPLFFPTFKEKRWFLSATTHPSFRNENAIKLDGLHLDDFDRMEFLGDSFLNWTICKKLYQLFPEANEGFLSRLRSILVSKKILNRIAKEIKLFRHLRFGKSLQEHPDVMNSKMISDCLEAFFAALYFDCGPEKTEKFILKIFKPYLDSKRLLRLDPNPKGALQELSQKHWQKIPVYSFSVDAQGEVTVIVEIGSSRKASAHGKNRKEAEEKAARMLIRKIRQDLLVLSKRNSSGKKLRKAP